MGEENRIKQLFMSLLLNSIDAVLAGGIIRVILSANEEDRFVEVRNKIFNPF